ncbi:MAG: thermonuclease family protein, partial [Geminicoccaceae bacterium]
MNTHRLSASLIFLLVTLGAFGAVGITSADAVAEDAARAPLDVSDVTENGALVLADGQKICLAGIWFPEIGDGEDIPSAWLGIIADGALTYISEPPALRDRYGCPVATVERRGGRSLQEALVSAGWAVVDPMTMSGDELAIDWMLTLEARARAAGLGIWKDRSASPRTVEDLAGWIGTRQLVEGRVRRTYSNKRYVYLNFGADWRTDFTARLDRSMLEARSMDAADFEGKALRVRGVLE